jgi:hypothetical protein
MGLFPKSQNYIELKIDTEAGAGIESPFVDDRMSLRGHCA